MKNRISQSVVFNVNIVRRNVFVEEGEILDESKRCDDKGCYIC